MDMLSMAIQHKIAKKRDTIVSLLRPKTHEVDHQGSRVHSVYCTYDMHWRQAPVSAIAVEMRRNLSVGLDEMPASEIIGTAAIPIVHSSDARK